MRRFEGRHALVTGASRGIGAATAERLAAEGASIVLVARTAEHHEQLAGSLAETVARCRTLGARAEAVVADLADAEDRAKVPELALDHLDGRVDILVNNAAAAIYAPTLEHPLRRRRLSFEVNVHAPLDLIQALVPAMVERGEGWVVNLSSATARPMPGPPFTPTEITRTMGVYGATKAALNRITNALALELWGTGVRVNTVEPRAAVMSEGASALVGDLVPDSAVEPMETMVEAVAALCCCGPELTGRHAMSLDLLAELDLPVRNLDATLPG